MRRCQDLDIKISLGGWSEFEGDDLSSPFLLTKTIHYEYTKQSLSKHYFRNFGIKMM